MKVFVLSSQKGGVGKSTLAVNLACESAQVTGKPSVVLDLDPQGSCSLWAQLRATLQQTQSDTPVARRPASAPDHPTVDTSGSQAADPKPWLQNVRVITLERTALRATLMELRESGVANVFVDLPPLNKKWIQRVFQWADLVLMPVRPAYFDMVSGFETWKRVEDRPVRWVINAAFDDPADSGSVGRVVQAELNRTMQCVDTIVEHAAAWVMSAGAGLSVSEYAPASKPAMQLSALWSELNRFPEIPVKHRYG